MDIREKFKDIVVCECGARISISPTSKGICPACGRSLKFSVSSEQNESSTYTTFDPQDAPPPSQSISAHNTHPSAQASNVHIPMPDDGLDSAGRSTLTFVSDVKVRSREAANLVSRGKIVEAIALYRWICEEHPDYRDAYYGLGFCYYKLGDLYRSKWMLEKAVELEHPSAGKLLSKVNQKLEEESLGKKDTMADKVETNKVADNMGDFLLDERK